tara:strand:+ start:139 stop:396 length:258 start_codon:yes stop_codon:yes gene_type:complete
MKKITARSNKKKRTFTIRHYHKRKLYIKYRTREMTKKDFMICNFNAEEDWELFLKTNRDDYYIVRMVVEKSIDILEKYKNKLKQL